MQTATDIFLLIALAVIVFQDFKYRAISWYLIPLAFLTLLAKGLATTTTIIFFENSFFNAVFILLQLILISVYISIKNKKRTNIVNSYLGIGDILFFAVLCVAFSPANFIVFFIVSLVLTLIGFIVYKIIFKSAKAEIPLAGAMAVLFILLIVTGKFTAGFNLYNDDHVLNMLTK